jgi:hypothetical protein
LATLASAVILTAIVGAVAFGVIAGIFLQQFAALSRQSCGRRITVKDIVVDVLAEMKKSS